MPSLPELWHFIAKSYTIKCSHTTYSNTFVEWNPEKRNVNDDQKLIITITSVLSKVDVTPSGRHAINIELSAAQSTVKL